MKIQILKSKIHGATVTEARIDYIGSITIDENIMKAAQLHEYEWVHVFNLNNGERIETYVIKGQSGSGTICLNGPAARKFLPGDRIIIISTCYLDEKELEHHVPILVFPNEKNQII
ncbi:MAG: aspartate 1-decarboxylase [Bacteroidales bacterium]|nr:aspartate 1-decarboxylase [Bacteroidales bacterium]